MKYRIFDVRLYFKMTGGDLELQTRNIKLVFAKKDLDEKEDLWSEALKIDKHCTIIGGVGHPVPTHIGVHIV